MNSNRQPDMVMGLPGAISAAQIDDQAVWTMALGRSFFECGSSTFWCRAQRVAKKQYNESGRRENETTVPCKNSQSS